MPSEPPASQSSPVLSQSTRWALAFTVLSVIALRWAAWDAPTLRDEGLYGYIAQEVLRGYLPLETAIDNKGPVLFYQWALALSLGGLSSIEAIRALGTLFVVGSILVLFVLGRDLGGPRVGLWSAVLLAFHTSLAEMDGYYYATEFYTMLPCLVAAGLVWRGVQEGKGQLCAWAGVFLGLAVWTRLTSLTLLAAFGLFVLWMAPRSHKLRHSLNLALGLAAISLVFSAVYAVPGKLVVLYDAWVAFPSVQVLTRNAFVTEADQLWEVARVAVPQTVLLWFPALAAVLSGRLPSPQRHFVLSSERT